MRVISEAQVKRIAVLLLLIQIILIVYVYIYIYIYIYIIKYIFPQSISFPGVYPYSNFFEHVNELYLPILAHYMFLCIYLFQLCGDTVCDIPEYRDCAECLLREQESDSVEKTDSTLDCSALTCPERQLVDKLSG